MIASGVVVYVSCQPVDFRKGAASLMALVRDGGLDPFSGALHVFRSKRADRVRIVWWDGSGVCLYSKTLEEHSFCWPARSVRMAVGSSGRSARDFQEFCARGHDDGKERIITWLSRRNFWTNCLPAAIRMRCLARTDCSTT
ncbi:IS66 family insertion sequence element accessory protein TnpB [Allomesorhizobium camelthorni]